MDIKKLRERYGENKKEIKERIKLFSKLEKEDHIKELLFCLLTPQSKAEKCWQAVLELENCEEENKIKACLKIRTRFHNNKARYVIEARDNWLKIRELINSKKSPQEIRDELTKNVKGLGMKEASHFLRNVGKSRNQLAILDRHILRNLIKLGIIDKEIKLDKKNYLETEEKMRKFSKQAGIPLDELDLLFFKLESGRIFK